jgi:CheY-like chemotaxis protein
LPWQSRGVLVLDEQQLTSAVLEAALDYRPNVVLLDIGLPGLDGFEVAKLVRRQPALQHVVLVAMTGYGRESDRQRSREAGFDHHLVKPGDFGKVLQILAAVPELPAK